MDIIEINTFVEVDDDEDVIAIAITPTRLLVVNGLTGKEVSMIMLLENAGKVSDRELGKMLTAFISCNAEYVDFNKYYNIRKYKSSRTDSEYDTVRNRISTRVFEIAYLDILQIYNTRQIKHRYKHMIYAYNDIATPYEAFETLFFAQDCDNPDFTYTMFGNTLLYNGVLLTPRWLDNAVTLDSHEVKQALADCSRKLRLIMETEMIWRYRDEIGAVMLRLIDFIVSEEVLARSTAASKEHEQMHYSISMVYLTAAVDNFYYSPKSRYIYNSPSTTHQIAQSTQRAEHHTADFTRSIDQLIARCTRSPDMNLSRYFYDYITTRQKTIVDSIVAKLDRGRAGDVLAIAGIACSYCGLPSY